MYHSTLGLRVIKKKKKKPKNEMMEQAKQELRFTFEDQKLPRDEAPPLP